MPPINNKGNPHSQVWVIADRPYPDDYQKGYVFSSGMGYVFDRMMSEAGLNSYYVFARRPDLEHLDTFSVVENYLNQYKPPLIVTLGDVTGWFCPEVQKKQTKGSTDEQESNLEKYSGSLLTSAKLSYNHYIVPALEPMDIIRDWSIRDIVVSLDLGKVKSELDYLKTHGHLEPLPQYNLEFNYETAGHFPELLYKLDNYKSFPMLSVDIESIYPRTHKGKKSLWEGHPGYPITIGLAPNAKEGISFQLFRESASETLQLWQKLNEVLRTPTLLGQNFFNFDFPRLWSMGFEINTTQIQDTLIRHHILWPELPHKLQFQTRQYTRQPYYKDEGQGWSIKNLQGLKHYNCLDCCVTYKIYEEQEKEFQERAYLL